MSLMDDEEMETKVAKSPGSWSSFVGLHCQSCCFPPSPSSLLRKAKESKVVHMHRISQLAEASCAELWHASLPFGD